jgi:oxygen-dependent protoporphyrinogen oxidase
VDAVLPRFVQMETKYGSLGRAMVAARKNTSSAAPRPLFTSLKSGMQQMTDALIARIPKEVFRPGVRVEAVKPESGKWLVISNGRTEEFEAVVIATPAHAAAALLPTQPELVTELRAIPYTSSTTVVLGYDETVRGALPAGFGFLVPRAEGRKILAATFVHNKFPHRAPENRAIIRCFIGGSVAEEMFEHSEADIATAVERELKSILGFSAAPLFTRVYKWRKAMAQYTVGHSARVSRIKSLVTQLPGLALAGNAYSGIGVPDCVRTGTEAAASVLAGPGFESRS